MKKEIANIYLQKIKDIIKKLDNIEKKLDKKK